MVVKAPPKKKSFSENVNLMVDRAVSHLDFRTAAMYIAVRKVAQSYLDQGVWP